MSTFEHPVWRWNPWREPRVEHISLGSDRYVKEPEPMPPKHPIGFVRRPANVEPLTWEGDDA